MSVSVLPLEVLFSIFFMMLAGLWRADHPYRVQAKPAGDEHGPAR
jgi:hypothetical protein